MLVLDGKCHAVSAVTNLSFNQPILNNPILYQLILFQVILHQPILQSTYPPPSYPPPSYPLSTYPPSTYPQSIISLYHPIRHQPASTRSNLGQSQMIPCASFVPNKNINIAKSFSSEL